MKKRYFLILLILGFALVFWTLFKDATAPTNETPAIVPPHTLAPEQPAAQIEGMITVEQPLPGSNISSPLYVKGSARGNWYFESSFPVSLIDSSGTVIATGIANAQGDWMTTDFVPFTATLKYALSEQSKGGAGYLILKKDNPSGDPARDQSLSVPVKF